MHALKSKKKNTESARVCELLRPVNIHTRGRKGETTEQHKKKNLNIKWGKDKMAVAAEQISHTEPFDFSYSSEWPRWIRRFVRFLVASGLMDKPEEYQLNQLLYAMGLAADDSY